MSDYANDRADKHKRMMQSNRKSVSEFLLTDAEMIEIDNALKEGWDGKSDDTPLQTKAVNEAKQDYVADRNARTRLDEQLRKERMNEVFWRGVMRFITHITLVLIVVYALFHFA